VLERQGRSQEYLYLAEAEGQTERYVAMLVRLGRVQELAGERWPELCTVLLAHVHRARSDVPQGPVEIFLHEGRVEDAMRAVEHSASYSLADMPPEAVLHGPRHFPMGRPPHQPPGLVLDGLVLDS
jgi:hypothetical protein